MREVDEVHILCKCVCVPIRELQTCFRTACKPVLSQLLCSSSLLCVPCLCVCSFWCSSNFLWQMSHSCVASSFGPNCVLLRLSTVLCVLCTLCTSVLLLAATCSICFVVDRTFFHVCSSIAIFITVMSFSHVTCLGVLRFVTVALFVLIPSISTLWSYCSLPGWQRCCGSVEVGGL